MAPHFDMYAHLKLKVGYGLLHNSCSSGYKIGTIYVYASSGLGRPGLWPSFVRHTELSAALYREIGRAAFIVTQLDWERVIGKSTDTPTPCCDIRASSELLYFNNSNLLLSQPAVWSSPAFPFFILIHCAAHREVQRPANSET